MIRRAVNRGVRASLLALLACLRVGVARAEQVDADARSDRDGVILRGGLARSRADHVLVSMLVENGLSHGRFGHAADEWRIGLGVAYRNDAWGPHLRALISPNGDGYEAFSGMVGGGLRAHFDSLGRPLFVGVGAHLETRLRDHVWLAYATPFEVGGLLFRRGSLRVRVVVGFRRVFAGDLVNAFLLDPNGFESEDARDELDYLLSTHPWQPFFSLDFSRVL